MKYITCCCCGAAHAVIPVGVCVPASCVAKTHNETCTVSATVTTVVRPVMSKGYLCLPVYRTDKKRDEESERERERQRGTLNNDVLTQMNFMATA